jgi:type VI secretion system secreted protein VgrG
VSGDDFQLQDLANIVCDFYVNAGTHATVLLQRVLNAMGANLVEDGSIGPASIKAVNGLDQVAVYRQYKQGRIDYYQSLGQKYPQFLQGWLNRVNAFPDL